MAKICIDPGHNSSGADTGAQGNGLFEQTLNLDIALRLRTLLLNNGFEVVTTRDEDFVNGPHATVNESLKTRCDIANSSGADLFVSIHVNAGGGTGTEIYALPGGRAVVAAQRVLERLVYACNWPNRGVKTDRELYVLVHTDMPAIITENGFIDSGDANKLANGSFRQVIAEAHAKGICDFFGVNYQQAPSSSQLPVSEPVPANSLPPTSTPEQLPEKGFKTSIMGYEAITLEQCKQRLNRINPGINLRIIDIYKRYGESLGIKWGYAVAQMFKETGYLRFGGNMTSSQNNFGGLDTTGKGEPGANFVDIEEGVLAHLEHLFAYATKAQLPVYLPKVDPRFDLVSRGCCPYWEDLDSHWAVPGTGYGEDIVRIYDEIAAEKIPVIPSSSTTNGDSSTAPSTAPSNPVQVVPQPTNKSWYDSKTLWVNTILFTAVMAQQITGKDILTPEIQASIITVINVLLRIVTKDKITW